MTPPVLDNTPRPLSASEKARVKRSILKYAKEQGAAMAYTRAIHFLNFSINEPEKSGRFIPKHAVEVNATRPLFEKQCRVLFKKYHVRKSGRAGVRNWADGEELVALRAVRAGRKQSESMFRDMRDLKACIEAKTVPEYKLNAKAKKAIRKFGSPPRRKKRR